MLLSSGKKKKRKPWMLKVALRPSGVLLVSTDSRSPLRCQSFRDSLQRGSSVMAMFHVRAPLCVGQPSALVPMPFVLNFGGVKPPCSIFWGSG